MAHQSRQTYDNIDVLLNQMKFVDKKMFKSAIKNHRLNFSLSANPNSVSLNMDPTGSISSIDVTNLLFSSNKDVVLSQNYKKPKRPQRQLPS
jgi:hypothetical protein